MEKGQLFIWCGRFNLEEDVSFDSSPNCSNSLGVEVDDDNRKLFEDFEKKLQSLTGDGELKLIKYGRVYLKIYVNERAKWHQNSGRFFAKMGKSTKKQFGTKTKTTCVNSIFVNNSFVVISR